MAKDDNEDPVNAENNQDTRSNRTPIYPKVPSNIPVRAVFLFIELLERHGQLSQFRASAEAAKAFITADPQTVRFIKDFVAAHPALRDDPLGMKVMGTAGGHNQLHVDNLALGRHECQLS